MGLKTLLNVILLLFFVTLSFRSYNQDQSIADSLKIIFNEGTFPDSLHFKILDEIAFNENNPDESIYYANLLISKATDEQNLEWLRMGHFEKGSALRLKGNYDESFEQLFKALEIAIRINKLSGVGSTYTAIADTYSGIGNSKEAIQYYNRAINILRQSGDSIRLATTLLNVGDEYIKLQDLDSALQYFLESSIVFNQKKYEMGQAYSLGNIGMVYAKQGKIELAEANFNEAIRMLEELEEYYALAVYQSYMSDIFLEKGDLERALIYARKSLKLGTENKLKEQIRDGALKISQIYERMDNNDDAFRFLKTYTQYLDSLNREAVIQRIADVRREFEVSQKQLEVDLLNQQKQNQQIIGIGLIVIILLSAGLLINVYRNYQRKKRLSAELQQLNETKDKFFSIISHDLRSPMSAFYGISRMIRFYVENNKLNDLQAMTDQIDQSVTSINSLLDNLLGWAVQQQGQLPYNPQKIDVNELLDTIKEIFTTIAEVKNIELLSSTTSNGLTVWVDRNSTMTILRNLVANAIKFTQDGGRIQMTARESNGMVAISIKDSGIGIKETELDHLFQFEEARSSYGTKGEKGIGLGLQLVKEFTSLNKGTISVESEVGDGTTFILNLPTATRVKEVLIDQK